MRAICRKRGKLILTAPDGPPDASRNRLDADYARWNSRTINGWNNMGQTAGRCAAQARRARVKAQPYQSS